MLISDLTPTQRPQVSPIPFIFSCCLHTGDEVPRNLHFVSRFPHSYSGSSAQAEESLVLSHFMLCQPAAYTVWERIGHVQTNQAPLNRLDKGARSYRNSLSGTEMKGLASRAVEASLTR